MMKIEIKNGWTGNTIIVGEYESIKDALLKNRDADLCDAYLRGADLRGAYLRGADLRDADLRDADLRDANLCDAWLYGSHIPGLLSIQGSSWPLFAYQDYIRIGCERWPVEHWLENYQVIGEKHNYTPEQIIEYRGYIDLCAQFLANYKVEEKQTA